MIHHLWIFYMFLCALHPPTNFFHTCDVTLQLYKTTSKLHLFQGSHFPLLTFRPSNKTWKVSLSFFGGPGRLHFYVLREALFPKIFPLAPVSFTGKAGIKRKFLNPLKLSRRKAMKSVMAYKTVDQIDSVRTLERKFDIPFEKARVCSSLSGTILAMLRIRMNYHKVPSVNCWISQMVLI